uniref:TFR_dimer domain-containing protein n=1 Tax=Steinernema glaseri TaxID=37863 RepID=A0A1I7ZFB3_9BILA
MLTDYVRLMDGNLRKNGITTALGPEFYVKAMQHLSVALEEFGNAADRLQHYVGAIHSGEKGVTIRQLEQLNSRIQLLERAFISEQGIYPERSFYRHVVFAASEMNDYGGVTFALIMDPVQKWLQATSESERQHWLETVKLGFTRLQYAIESATLTIKFEYGY